MFLEVHRLLIEWGFTYLGQLGQFCVPHDNHPLQQDRLFVKRLGS